MQTIFKNQFELNSDNVSYNVGEGDNNFSFCVICMNLPQELKAQALKTGTVGEWDEVYVFDRKFSTYTPGTQMLLETFDEDGFEWESIEQYVGTVEHMESIKSVAEAKEFIYEMGTDYVNRMKLHKEWESLMFSEKV